MTLEKNWLLYRCALCGEYFPLGPEWRANLSNTSHRAILPCPCETRRPPDPPEQVFTPDETPTLRLKRLNDSGQLKPLLEKAGHKYDVWRAVDAELERDR